MINERIADSTEVTSFVFYSPYARDFEKYLETLAPECKSRFLSRLLEMGWVCSQIANSKIESDYFEKTVKSCFLSLEHNLQEKEESYLESIQESINDEIEELKDLILSEKYRKEQSDIFMDKTTIKGFQFEEEVLASLSTLASHRSDIVTFVGDSPGVGKSKKGDFIYEHIASNRIISIEAKNLSSRMSPNKVLELTQDSISNRSASFGILVTKTSAALPDCFGGFYLGDNYIACEYSYLQIAIKMAIVLMTKSQQIAHLNVEYFIKDTREEIRSLEEMGKLVLGLKTSSKKLETSIKQMKEALENKIEKVINEDCHNDD